MACAGNVHPALLLPEILESIFRYSSVEDLKACRRVSKFWRDSSVEAWRKSATVRIYLVDEAYSKSMSDFLYSTRGQDISHLYSNFNVCFRLTPNDISTYDAFWGFCGNQVRRLRLERCNFPTSGAFRKLIFQTFPNLEQLELGSVNVQATFDERRTLRQVNSAGWVAPRFGENKNVKILCVDIAVVSHSCLSWMEIFTHFPSLEILKISYLRERDVDAIFEAVNEIRKRDSNKLKLRKIHARISDGDSTATSASLVQIIRDPNLSLENISFSLDGPNSVTNLSEFLRLHGGTLTYLELDRHSQEHLDPHDCFPYSIRDLKDRYLLLLRELQLQSHVFTSLEFLKFIPNLVKLSIIKGAQDMTENTSSSFLESFKHEKCMSLELGDFMSVDSLQNIFNILPNLERVRLPLDNILFLWLCEKMPNLVTLDIIKSKVNESGFTGLDAEQVELINNTGGLHTLDTMSSGRRANISNLKKLRNLYMESDGSFPKISMEFCAALYGIQELPNLQRVKLSKVEYNPEILVTSFRKYGSGEYIKILD